MTTTVKQTGQALAGFESFVPRHIGQTQADLEKMVAAIGFSSLDDLIDATIPEKIRFRKGLDL